MDGPVLPMARGETRRVVAFTGGLLAGQSFRITLEEVQGTDDGAFYCNVQLILIPS